MKKTLILAIALVAFMASEAMAQNVSFVFSDGIANKTLKTKIESQISRLLTAINTAAENETDINYSGIDIDPLASKSIGMTWRVARFSTIEDDIVDHCITEKTKNGRIRGYQVRNIEVKMYPVDPSYDGPEFRELVISVSPQGVIENANFAIGNTEMSNIFRLGSQLQDLDRRMQIVHWCEQLQNAYNTCDISFMDNIFSDDALIITGRLTSRRVQSEMAVRSPADVEYIRQTKAQYLNGLRRVFRNSKYVNVKFSDFKIVRHGSKPNYYGVTLRQNWSTNNYHDEGILFLVWDFSDEDMPKIHVRTWQPLTEEAFTLGNFVLP